MELPNAPVTRTPPREHLPPRLPVSQRHAVAVDEKPHDGTVEFRLAWTGIVQLGREASLDEQEAATVTTPICGEINTDVTHSREMCPCTQPHGHMATAPELGHECDCGAAWGWQAVSRDKRRMRLLPAVAKFARSPEFRAVTGRETTIITVLPDDTVTYVLDRLAEAESPAVLVLPGDEGMRVVKLTEVKL